MIILSLLLAQPLVIAPALKVAKVVVDVERE